MAHQVENMFSVGSTPWHGLGTVLEKAPTSKDAIVCAGLDWTVNERPLTVDGSIVPSHKAMVRSSDSRILGVVGSSYNPLQNVDAFKFFDNFISAGECVFETAGSLQGGSRIWILARLNRDPSIIVKGDEISKYILLAHAHDGSLAITTGFTPVRVVCANTLAMAREHSQSKLLRVKHTKNLAMNLDAVRDTMNLANVAFEATAEQYRRLAYKDINAKDLEKYVKVVFETPEAATKTRVVEPITRLFESGRGNSMPGVRGTLWAAYNAVTEYIAYERGASNDTRLNAAWFGPGAELNKRALGEALRMAA